MIVHTLTPYNAEPPPERLRAAFITPNQDFYVRCHGTIPTLDPDAYRLRINGHVTTELSLSLTELRSRFTPRSLTATMQCAGNRRADMHRLRPVSGDPWGPGAIGTAEWTGIPLADVLEWAGAAPDAAHVAFACADECEAGAKQFRYGVSVPMPKARSPDVLLCYEMNGEPLQPEHGAPLRALVPGYAGTRSPKWLQAVTVQDHPSDNPIQIEDYQLVPPGVTDPAQAITINALPVNSAICDPGRDARLSPGLTVLRGYATASDRAIVRVEVTADGGQSWIPAVLADPQQPWSWVFWHATLDLPLGHHELSVRAWDDAGQTQPADPNDLWNQRGYLSAAWHRIPVEVTGR